MVPSSAGAVVLVRFPFSDLSQSKLRPALCQVTSNPYGDPRAVRLEEGSFASGSLRAASYARPGKLFTASEDLMMAQIGNLKPEPFRGIIHSVVTLLRAGGPQ